ncbi:TPA: hypothetical protein HA241_05920 [Candidatus Woesearchaeota archaeon]|nr:hypothetical protein [Candidatus Woesearchaeota archaeon]
METITIPKIQFEQMQVEIETLRHSSIYKRLMEFEQNIVSGRKLSRNDLGF